MLNNQEVDLALIAEVQKGNTHAFDTLVLKYQYRIYKLVSRYSDDPSEALDITQDAFIKAYQALNKFRGESSFYTWLYRIASNVAKNHLASKGRRVPDIDIDIFTVEQRVGNPLQKDLPEQEKLLLSEELSSLLLEVIKNLPDELKAAILLREVDGMTYSDIANIMGCPVGTVRSRIYRAREIIGKKVEPFIANRNYFG